MDIDALKEKLEPLFKEHEIQKAILFGSCARNEASRYSDLDLILVKDKKRRFLDCYEGVLSSFSQALLDQTPARFTSRRILRKQSKKLVFLDETRNLMERE